MIQVFKKKNNEYEEIENHPQPEHKGSLKRLIQTVHEFHIDYKCESCGKSFTGAHNLKIHIFTVHEGHKDYKCESCSKSYSQPQHLKKHIQSKDHKAKEASIIYW